MTPAAASGDEGLFSGAVLFIYLLCPLNILSLLFVTAPYGKHSRAGWGPIISPAIAWFLMESPTLWLPLLLLPAGRHSSNPIALFILCLFFVHYIHRTLIYPLRLRRLRRPAGSIASGFPLSVAAIAFVFNFLNAYVQTRSVSHYSDYGGRQWRAGVSTAARVAIGLSIFIWGMAVNIRSDLALVKLKAEGGRGYKIPRGGWFEAVSCPNYMGEVAEWLGWAVVAWSPAALGFFFFTASNLVPRARSHHKWYVDKFGEDYPTSRKAILPFVF
ncbi:Steroid 5-alpha-reductase DET2 [Apostasia shenzhenica]|uniref:Steroid 5-alpha-reductase DET2 n=1 Tax=Apostasia shenzhenica TaxID=1088818 RepID=A0A2I0BAX7_9ASPA|nr:Steroid 5-alpha-reductase DET2 [Apostasia shenzhenica]